jgi:hypothetical protein
VSDDQDGMTDEQIDEYDALLDAEDADFEGEILTDDDEPAPQPVTPIGAVWLAIADVLELNGWDGRPEDWRGVFHSEAGVPYGVLQIVIQPGTGLMGGGALAALTPDALIRAIRISAHRVKQAPRRHLRVVSRTDHPIKVDEAIEQDREQVRASYRTPFDWEQGGDE